MAFGSGVNERLYRLYSGNGFYVNLFQVGQPDLPGMEPAAETGIRDDGGRMTQYAITYITDEKTPFEPISVSFSAAIMPEYIDVQKAIGNWIDAPTWQIGAHVWTPVLTSNIGTRYNSAGVATPAQFPVSARQLLYMTNLCWSIATPAAAPTGVSLYGEGRGFVVSNVTVGVEDMISIANIEGMIYGQVRWNLTDWPAGTESIPS